MGSLIYRTDKTASQILSDHLCHDAVKIRMFTTDHEAACVALAVDLNKASDDYKTHLRRIYDLDPAAQYAYPAVIAKASGLKGSGMRSVEIALMDEDKGPFYTGGANRQLLDILSPLQIGSPLVDYAIQWRTRAARKT